MSRHTLLDEVQVMGAATYGYQISIYTKPFVNEFAPLLSMRLAIDIYVWFRPIGIHLDITS